MTPFGLFVRTILLSALVNLIGFTASSGHAWASPETRPEERNLRPASGRIIRPHPILISEISSFNEDWCSKTRSHRENDAEALCFGEVTFQNEKTIRAIAIVRYGQKRDLYIENGIPDVTLSKTSFDIIGPVRSTSGFEMGSAKLSIDTRGEVEAVHVWTPSLGSLAAFR